MLVTVPNQMVEEIPYIRFHDLRHSAATMLLSMKVHSKIVQELLGHNRIQETVDT